MPLTVRIPKLSYNVRLGKTKRDRGAEIRKEAVLSGVHMRKEAGEAGFPRCKGGRTGCFTLGEPERKYMEKIEYVLPGEIEKRSFEIIGAELEARGIVLPREQEAVTKRVIHTSADFDYAETLAFSKDAVKVARELLKRGADIVTDTNMAKAGINKSALAKLGGEVHCFMADEDVAREAKERRVTRATISMERAAALPGPVIFAIGNAPTALISLYELMAQGTFTPEFVIGVPVGFVNVVPAKELFLGGTVPYIINRGRKGGSNIAAAICNALLYGIETA